MKPFVPAGSSRVTCYFSHLPSVQRKSPQYTVRVPWSSHPPVIRVTWRSHIYDIRVHVCILWYLCLIVSNYPIFSLKMSWWINTKKCLKEAAKRNGCGRIGCLIYRFYFFFFCTALRPKKKLRKKKKSHLWEGMVRTALVFLSLLLLISTFSHTKSVIIAQETRNTDYVIVLTKTWQLQEVIQLFFSFLSSCDITSGKEGEEV